MANISQVENLRTGGIYSAAALNNKNTPPPPYCAIPSLKIGIMAFWGAENYGRNLQAFAAYKWLSDMGHDVFIIKYDGSKWISISMSIFNIAVHHIYFFLRKKTYRQQILKNFFCKNKIRTLLWGVSLISDPFDIRVFTRNHIKFSPKCYPTVDSLIANPPQADLYIIGSDQIWNLFVWGPEKRNDIIKAYFLDFGSDKIKRVSYAASWNNFVLDESYINKITPLLKKFNYVSVREKDGVDKCKLCGREDAEWVPDPTLLLPPDKYRELYDASCKKLSGKYVFAYILHHPDTVCSIADYAALRGLKTVIVSPAYMRIGGHKITCATIPQWLYLIENAEYVITDSFHGTIFSMQFGKNFANIGMENDSRFISLYEMFGIPRRAVKADDFSILDTPPDYTTINAHLKAIREKYTAAWFDGVAGGGASQ